jgi:hypothetical protein
MRAIGAAICYEGKSCLIASDFYVLSSEIDTSGRGGTGLMDVKGRDVLFPFAE